MPNFDYVTAAVTISGVRTETMQNDKAVHDALNTVLAGTREYIKNGHLANISIDVSVYDCGEAVTYTEPTFYIAGKKVDEDIDPAPEVYF